MKKASPKMLLAGGGVALVLVGLLLFGVSGNDAAEQQEKGAAAQRANALEGGLTKEEIKERQAHLLRTQQALAAAEPEPTQAPAEKAAPAAPAEVEPSPAPAVAQKASGSGPAPAKAPVASKKKLDSLDSLGSDITSALK